MYFSVVYRLHWYSCGFLCYCLSIVIGPAVWPGGGAKNTQTKKQRVEAKHVTNWVFAPPISPNSDIGLACGVASQTCFLNLSFRMIG